METLNIEKDINLHVIKSNKFKTTSICVIIRRNLNRKDVTYNAIIPNILKNGCSKYDTLKKINEKIESMFGAVFDASIIKKGEEQLIQFYIEVINKKDLIMEALDFLNEIILNPLVKDGGFFCNYVEIEKENLRKTINGKINDKREYAKIRCIEEMCKDEHFSIYGDGYEEDLSNINNKNIYEYYNKVLADSPIDFILIGDVNSENIKEYIKENFNFKRENIIKIPKSNFEFKYQETKEIKENLDIAQGKLCIGLRAGINPVNEDFYNLIVANEILGGGASSYLFLNLREKENLCYYINSVVYRFKSIILIQSGIDKNNFSKSIDLIKKEIENIKKGDFSDKDFENAKKGLIKKYEVIEDYPSSTIDFYISQYMLNDKDNLDDVKNKIKNVTKENAAKAIKDLFLDTIYFLERN